MPLSGCSHVPAHVCLLATRPRVYHRRGGHSCGVARAQPPCPLQRALSCARLPLPTSTYERHSDWPSPRSWRSSYRASPSRLTSVALRCKRMHAHVPHPSPIRTPKVMVRPARTPRAGTWTPPSACVLRRPPHVAPVSRIHHSITRAACAPCPFIHPKTPTHPAGSAPPFLGRPCTPRPRPRHSRVPAALSPPRRRARRSPFASRPHTRTRARPRGR